MDNRKWYKNPEMIVALSALLIGLVTAFTSIYSAYVDRSYAKASVWPRLEIYKSSSGGTFSYSVANNGTGPALIKYAKVSDGKKYIKRWSDVKSFQGIIQSHIGNRSLSPQKTIVPLLYKGDNMKPLLEADKTLSIELCYCSIYDECWSIDRQNQPISVESCVVNNEQVFLQ